MAPFAVIAPVIGPLLDRLQHGRRWTMAGTAVVRGVLARRPEDLRIAGLLLLATIPAGVIGVVFHRQVEAAASLVLVGLGFVVTGFMNWSTRRFGGGDRPQPSVGAAVGIGFAQAVAAVFRGVSRSGSTVCAALWAGLGPAAAAEFGFLLAIPVIGGAALVEGRHMAVNVAAVGAVPLAVSFAVAFASGIWSIRFLVALLKRGRFYAFAPYNWLAGVLTIAYALWRR